MVDEEEQKETMQRELQSRVITYKALESNLTNFARQKDMLFSKLMEIQNTIASVEEINKSKSDVLFSVGSAAYSKGKPIDKNNLIIEIGAGVAVEKTIDEAKSILESRKKELEKAIENTQSEMNKIVSAMQQLEEDTQKILSGARPGAEREAAEDVEETEGAEEKFRVISNESEEP